jgi:hypothetical protein
MADRKKFPNVEAIYQRVLAGELSPHAGMIEAGFRKPSVRKKLTRVERIKRKMVDWHRSERREIYNHLKKEFA